MNRTAYDEPGPAGQVPFLPEQALTLETAFAAYTSGSAWVNHRDDAGVLAVGKVADLVVLDRDPFAGPADEIGATGSSRRGSRDGRSSKRESFGVTESVIGHANPLQIPLCHG